ncbi:M48 family metallopeptidase [Spiroplasma endosymbiont of Labia minor]|uniref:M48 family metallopeptidase n=1 Tax=Spiroplasma endosymbiont of Labia minor TaxID=3066305 RepID=UPI0030D43B75
MAIKAEYIVKKISYQGSEYFYYFKINQKRKLIGLRVKNGEMYVSAPEYAQQWDVERLIYRNMPKIIEMRSSYSESIKFNFDGLNSWVKIFDKPYKLKVVNENIHAIMKDDGFYMKFYPTKLEQTKKMYTFLAKQYYNWFKKETDMFAARLGVTYKNLTIKSMDTRWGVCYPMLGKIILNPSLIHFSVDVIDYVIIHELTHLLFPNHSANFKHFIAKHLPNYRQMEQTLKKRGL